MVTNDEWIAVFDVCQLGQHIDFVLCFSRFFFGQTPDVDFFDDVLFIDFSGCGVEGRRGQTSDKKSNTECTSADLFNDTETFHANARGATPPVIGRF